MEIFGPPSPPPEPLSPIVQPAAAANHSAISLWPPVASLPSLVDAAMQEVRLYQYKVPEHLVETMDLQLKHANCQKMRAKHPWMNLENHFFPSLPRAVWTDNPADATFFVVPHSYLGHQCTAKLSVAQWNMYRGIARFFEYIFYGEPYFNRTNGRDHVTTWVFENGPLCDCRFREIMKNESLAFRVLMDVAKVGYWGHRDNAMFGWRAGVDIALPQWGAPSAPPGLPPTWTDVVSKPKTSYGFSGSYWGTRVTCPATDKGAEIGELGAKHSCECSPNTRTWLKTHMTNSCSKPNATSTRCSGLLSSMGSFWYALCPAAWACWSSRLFHAIDNLVVPAVMANGAIEPFEGILDWKSFAVRLDTSRLVAGNTSQLDWLHHDARVTERQCAGCPTCHSCTRLPLVKRIRQLEHVRPWFRYNQSSPYSAFGLFLLEIHCRQWSLKNGGEGVCKRRLHEHRDHGRRRHPERDFDEQMLY